MAGLADDERPLKDPFWTFETPEEERVVDALLRRRFPEAYRRLAAVLEETDPLDLVYPDNPGEYNDVVLEILVLLAPVGGVLRGLTAADLAQIIWEGLLRRFGEEPDSAAVHRAAELLADVG